MLFSLILTLTSCKAAENTTEFKLEDHYPDKRILESAISPLGSLYIETGPNQFEILCFDLDKMRASSNINELQEKKAYLSFTFRPGMTVQDIVSQLAQEGYFINTEPLVGDFSAFDGTPNRLLRFTLERLPLQGRTLKDDIEVYCDIEIQSVTFDDGRKIILNVLDPEKGVNLDIEEITAAALGFIDADEVQGEIIEQHLDEMYQPIQPTPVIPPDTEPMGFPTEVPKSA